MAGRVPGRFSAGLARRVALLLDRAYLSTRIVGRKHVPKSGPVILAGNHSGLLDGPVVIGAAPRGTHFLIKAELVRGLAGKIFLLAGQVPVNRSDGRAALEICLKVLQDGRVVGIFPEGTRGTGRVGGIHAGVAWLAVNSGAPVIPVACLGTRREGESIHKIPSFRRRVHVEFGNPISLPDPAPTTQESIAAAIPIIHQALAAHVAEVERRTALPLPTT